MYREDKNLEVTIVESAEAKIDKKEEIKLRQEKRVVDEINKRADLNKDRDPRTAWTSLYESIHRNGSWIQDKELERNAEIEATILKWTNYKNKGSYFFILIYDS